jgi:hypothetical protein
MAWCIWPRAELVTGEGPYGTVARCRRLLAVRLHATLDAAAEAYASGCTLWRCTDAHELIRLVLPTEPDRVTSPDVLQQRVREHFAPDVAAGRVRCWRCGELIEPGTTWRLGHGHDDRLGPEHPSCEGAPDAFTPFDYAAWCCSDPFAPAHMRPEDRT